MKVQAHSPSASVAQMQEQLRLLKAENAALKARGPAGKVPGWYQRNVPEPKNKDSEKGLFLADRILPGGCVMSFYVGVNGKLTFGGGFGSRGFGIWGSERDAFLTYAESGDMRKDLDRPELVAAHATAYVKT